MIGGSTTKNLAQKAFESVLNKTLSIDGIRTYFQRIILTRSLKIRLPKSFPKQQNLRILAICCYMADRPSLVEDLIKSAEESKYAQIDLVITNNTNASPSSVVKPYIKYM